MDIVVWLRSLGLGKYEAAFRENEIDETVLPSLTDEHLKELGVTALGHRGDPLRKPWRDKLVSMRCGDRVGQQDRYDHCAFAPDVVGENSRRSCRRPPSR